MRSGVRVQVIRVLSLFCKDTPELMAKIVDILGQLLAARYAIGKLYRHPIKGSGEEILTNEESMGTISGHLDEASNFIQTMPVEPGINVYGAMLGACKIHKNVDLGEKAADKLFELQSEDGGYHVLLANIYAKVRTLMQGTGILKTPGCSSVDLGNEVHTFYSVSTSLPHSEKIYAFLSKMIERIKAAGYKPDSSSIHDVKDDVQEQLLNTYSEKLAIAFALINTQAPVGSFALLHGCALLSHANLSPEVSPFVICVLEKSAKVGLWYLSLSSLDPRGRGSSSGRGNVMNKGFGIFWKKKKEGIG